MSATGQILNLTTAPQITANRSINRAFAENKSANCFSSYSGQNHLKVDAEMSLVANN